MNVNGVGTTVPSSGTYSFPQGTQINISASPSEGWQFVNWTGSVTDTAASTTITMDGDKLITAVFTRVYSLNLSVNGNGTTDPAPGVYTYKRGNTINISATLIPGPPVAGPVGSVTLDPAGG